MQRVELDKIYGAGGRDLVTVWVDRFRDLIDCGSGHDTVDILDRRDPRDQFRSCERRRVIDTN